jgi:tRNA pseudouridine55 synthase
MTSHDVVARVRRIARTRRVGHGGTLDPMATGVLILGVERATRLLTYVIGTAKRYRATIRLGASTNTDDADGEITAVVDASGVSDAAIAAEVSKLTGEIDQVPSAVSAIKVNGVRSYARARAGEEVVLAPRRVTVSRFDTLATRRNEKTVDLDVDVECSSGTYIRALARDLGAALGVGGHLTALERTAVGGFTLDEAVTLDELAELAEPVTMSLAEAADRCLPRRELTGEQARVVGHGGPLPPTGRPGPYAAFDPDGDVVAVMIERDGKARPDVVFKAVG